MNILSLKQTPDLQDYILKEDDRTVLKLRYKHEFHTARVETENERRVLIIEDEGLLRTKLVLKNEYGIRIGALIYNNFSHTLGSVDIENTKYRFVYHSDILPELYIYKGSRRNLVYTCQLSAGAVQSKESKAQSASLIFVLSWYLFSKETVKERLFFNEGIIQ